MLRQRLVIIAFNTNRLSIILSSLSNVAACPGEAVAAGAGGLVHVCNPEPKLTPKT